MGFMSGLRMRMAIQSVSSAIAWGTYQVVKTAITPTQAYHWYFPPTTSHKSLFLAKIFIRFSNYEKHLNIFFVSLSIIVIIKNLQSFNNDPKYWEVCSFQPLAQYCPSQNPISPRIRLIFLCSFCSILEPEIQNFGPLSNLSFNSAYPHTSWISFPWKIQYYCFGSPLTFF